MKFLKSESKSENPKKVKGLKKDQLVILLLFGILLVVIAIPVSPQGDGSSAEEGSESSGIQTEEGSAGLSGGTAEETYEQRQERRLEEALRLVEGVGEVDVMITLKSTEEKVFRIDRDQSESSTEETDSSGGSRVVKTADSGETTVLTGSGSGESPVLEKELMPEIEGVVVSAQGGGDVRIQAEISAAMEALFHVPQHKIRVLKRVE